MELLLIVFLITVFIILGGYRYMKKLVCLALTLAMILALVVIPSASDVYAAGDFTPCPLPGTVMYSWPMDKHNFGTYDSAAIKRTFNQSQGDGGTYMFSGWWENTNHTFAGTCGVYPIPTGDTTGHTIIYKAKVSGMSDSIDNNLVLSLDINYKGVGGDVRRRQAFRKLQLETGLGGGNILSTVDTTNGNASHGGIYKDADGFVYLMMYTPAENIRNSTSFQIEPRMQNSRQYGEGSPARSFSMELYGIYVYAGDARSVASSIFSVPDTSNTSDANANAAYPLGSGVSRDTTNKCVTLDGTTGNNAVTGYVTASLPIKLYTVTAKIKLNGVNASSRDDARVFGFNITLGKDTGSKAALSAAETADIGGSANIKKNYTLAELKNVVPDADGCITLAYVISEIDLINWGAASGLYIDIAFDRGKDNNNNVTYSLYSVDIYEGNSSNRERQYAETMPDDWFEYDITFPGTVGSFSIVTGDTAQNRPAGAANGLMSYFNNGYIVKLNGDINFGKGMVGIEAVSATDVARKVNYYNREKSDYRLLVRADSKTGPIVGVIYPDAGGTGWNDPIPALKAVVTPAGKAMEGKHSVYLEMVTEAGDPASFNPGTITFTMKNELDDIWIEDAATGIKALGQNIYIPEGAYIFADEITPDTDYVGDLYSVVEGEFDEDTIFNIYNINIMNSNDQLLDLGMFSVIIYIPIPENYDLSRGIYAAQIQNGALNFDLVSDVYEDEDTGEWYVHFASTGGYFAIFQYDGGLELEFDWTVVFDSDGGSAVDSQQVKNGERLVRPEDPTKEDYRFIGWFEDDYEWDFDTDTVEGNILLIARWELIEDTVEPDTNGFTGDVGIVLGMVMASASVYGGFKMKKKSKK